MKKHYLLSFIFLFFVSNITLLAQRVEDFPNNGLNHTINKEDKLKMIDFSAGIKKPTVIPTAPVRNIAEFEPSEAVIIAYIGGFGLPYSVIRDLSNTGHVIIVTSTSSTTIMNLLSSNGVNTANCSVLSATIDSWWTRDYSAWFIIDGNNNIGIVDFTYNRPSRPNDDVIPGIEASYFGLNLYQMDLVHTGGNYMCDGYGNAVSTVLVSEENPTLTLSQIQNKALEYLGINNYMIRPDAQGAYIEHIDCWAKLLAPDKILVDSVPGTDARWAQYEAAASFFANTTCAYGYNYKVTRVLIAGSGETAAAEPYSNSYIFNNRVFVPIKGGTSAPHDTAAIHAYRNAMPGYIVEGYLSTGGAVWFGTDALHCRTHEIPDRQMMYIEHLPLYGNKPYSASGFSLTAKIFSYGNKTISATYPKLIYKVDGGNWDSTITMTNTGGNMFQATIPSQAIGSHIYYYLKSKDDFGKVGRHPLMGPADPHQFIVTDPVAINDNETPDFFINAFPNPVTDGNLSIYVTCEKGGPASLTIYTTLGQVIFTENIILNDGISLNKFKLNNTPKGVYIMQLKSENKVVSKQIVVQ